MRLVMDQAATSALYPKRRTKIQTLIPMIAEMRKRPKRKRLSGPKPGLKKSKPKARALKRESSRKTTKDRITPINQDPKKSWKGWTGAMKVCLRDFDQRS
jgi:hypothetical protein